MSAPAVPTRRKLDVETYYRMAEVGILGPEERVELIDGEMVEMVPSSSEHGGRAGRLHERLLLALAGRAFVTASSPLHIDALNEPEPDLLVLRRTSDDYADAHPTPAETWMVVEVADPSLPFDRTVKVELYAAVGEPEYWIVDVEGAPIEVQRDPGPRRWGERMRYDEGRLTLRQAPEAEIDVADRFR